MSELIETPASVQNVARHILTAAGDMSTMKLQKLCYFAQGWTLAWTNGRPLFSEDFQAWRNGPVCYPLFDSHRGQFSVSHEDIKPRGEPLQEWHKAAIDAAIKPYLRITGVRLSELTHEAGTPWSQAREGLPADASSNRLIEKEWMRDHFAERLPS